MTLRFRFEVEASEEMGEAALRYERQRDGLGKEFLEAVDDAMEFIRNFPHAGAPVPDLPTDLPVRRAVVRRFPFHIVYLEMSGVIRVLACAHDRRSPGYWHARVT